MPQIAGFSVVETLQQSEQTWLLRARRDGRSVLLRVPHAQRAHGLDRLRREYHVGRGLSSPCLVKPLSLEEHEGIPVLVLENFDATPLERLLGAPLPIGRWLVLAAQVTAAVVELHRNGLVHQALTPSSVLVAPDDTVKLVDLGLAAREVAGPRRPTPSELIEGALAYLAPEQSGRLHHVVDQRSDLYALGVIFYRMATGALPFTASDPLGWIQCHLTQAPRPPSDVRAEVPAPISAIILRLLAKLPEERYQSAAGLAHDLARCAALWARHGEIPPFSLGAGDRVERFQPPRRLYGRDRPLEQLAAAFDHVVATGAPALVTLTGGAGVGKSALVEQLCEQRAGEDVLILGGTCDRHRRDVPFVAFAEGFAGLVGRLLAAPEAERQAGRDWLQAVLDASGRVLTDVLPQVELILGRQPALPELPPEETASRLVAAFRRFAAGLASPKRPVVYFLDDLQWADPASLRLLVDAVMARTSGPLLVIAAYHDQEVDPSHPLTAALAEVRRAGSHLDAIALEPLSRDDVGRLVTDSLGCAAATAAPLADLVHARAAGNPLFTLQLLAALVDERLLAFDREAGRWTWDAAAIAGRRFSDHVGGLLVDRLRRLEDSARAALCLAACVGRRFDVPTLIPLLGGRVEALQQALSELVRDGLLLASDAGYAFAHERVREAADALVDPAARPGIHLAIGRLLRAHTPAAQLDEQVFDLVAHFERGAVLLTHPAERAAVAELFLRAGRRAKRTAAYPAARRYLAGGLALLPGDGRSHRALRFALRLEDAHCAYLSGDLDGAAGLLAALEGEARSAGERAELARVQIALLTLRGQPDEAVAAGLAALRHLGIEVPSRPSDGEVRRAYARVWQILDARGLTIEQLAQLPAAGAGARALIGLLFDLLAPTRFSRRRLFHLLLAQLVTTTVEHGSADGSVGGYALFGAALAEPMFGRYADAQRFGRLADALVRRCKQVALAPMVTLLDGDVIRPYGAQPRRDGRGAIEAAFLSAQENGVLSWACVCCDHFVSNLLSVGEPLDQVWTESEERLAFVRQARDPRVEALLISQRQLIRSLRGQTAQLGLFEDPDFDEARFLDTARRGRLPLVLCRHEILTLQARFFAGDHEEALRASARARPLLWATGSDVQVTDFFFYTALSCAARLDTAPADERAALWRTLSAHQEQLRQWAEASPVNFADRAALVDAEVARLRGDASAATRLYEEAIRAARAAGFLHHEALAHELAARCYRALDFELIAQTYLVEACARYERWGALGKTRQLERQFPRLRQQRARSAEGLMTRSERLALLSVMNAARALSREMVLDQVVATLLRVVLESSGAQRAYLVLLSREGESAITCATVGPDGLQVQPLGAGPAGAPALPRGVLDQVRRTKGRVLVDDVRGSTRFAGELTGSRRPRSVVCLPILRQDELVGLLYLENDRVAGAFTPDRLTALEFLASQAAISLENARVLAREQEARREAQEARRCADLLAQATALLTESLDLEQALQRLARLFLRFPASWCIIELVDSEGQLRYAAGAHVDPTREPLLADLRQRYPVLPGSPHPAGAVMRSGTPILLDDVDDELMHRATVDEAHRELLRKISIGSALLVPLVARHRTVGVLELKAAVDARRYNRADLALATELARRAALAVENAELLRRERQAVRLRDEFLSIASHELNTPMASLLLSLQALERGTESDARIEPATIRKLSGLALRQSKRLKRLIGNLLDVSRVETGQLTLESTLLDLGKLVADVAGRFEADLATARCELALHAEALLVSVDASRLDQVIANLLSNAIKFGAGRPIEVGLTRRGDQAVLTVRDHGIGIDPGARSRIFERFERAVSPDHYGGLGLGLYISHRIVVAHGGAITVDSRPGEGTCFTVELPLASSQGAGQEGQP